MRDSGIVNIRGKEYQTVALRVQNFRVKYPNHGLRTRIVEMTDDRVVMVAEVWQDAYLLATGHAEGRRGASQINKTSALENCETSAIGRALAALGLSGTEFASAEEAQKEPITEAQAIELLDLAETLPDGKARLEKYIRARYGIEFVDDLPAEEFESVKARIGRLKE